MLRKISSSIIIITLLLTTMVTSAGAATPVGYESSVQIRNLTSSSGTVNLTFYDLSGAQIGSPFSDSIAGNETKSYYQSTLPVTAGFNGSLVVSASVPVAAMSNLNGLDVSNNAISYASYNGFSAGSPNVYLPTLMKDNWGYNTFFYVQNTGSTVANVSIAYSDGTTNSITGLKPNQSAKIDQKSETHTPKVFSGTLTASASSIAVVVVEEGNTLFAYTGFGSGTPNPVMPLINQNNYGYFTGLQIQNTGASSTVVTVNYKPSLSGTSCYETRTIAAGASQTFSQYVFYANQVETDPAFATNCVKGQTFIGSAKVTTNTTAQNLVAVVNQNNLNAAENKGGAYSAFDPTSGQSKIVYPLIMDRNYGYFTSWSIYNVGSTPIAAGGMSCTVTGKDKLANPVTLVLSNSAAIAPDASWTLNHYNIIADGFVGGATCVGPTGAKVIGTSNQLGTGSRWTAKDSFLVSEGLAVAP